MEVVYVHSSYYGSLNNVHKLKFIDAVYYRYHSWTLNYVTVGKPPTAHNTCAIKELNRFSDERLHIYRAINVNNIVNDATSDKLCAQQSNKLKAGEQ